MHIKGLLFSPEDADLYTLPWQLRNGYASIHVYRPHRTTDAAHRMVCERAFGRRADRYGKGESTDHINRNKLDNRRSNLRIVSIRENNINREFNAPEGSDQWKAVLTERDVVEIRRIVSLKLSTQTALAKRLGCSVATVNDVVRGKSWKHVL